MTQLVIPCAIMARHSALAITGTGWFGTVLYDNGKLVSCYTTGDDQKPLMIVERVSGPKGKFHIDIDDEMLTAVRDGVADSADLIIDIDESTQFAMAYTTSGWMRESDVIKWSDTDPDRLGEWWQTKVVERSKAPVVDATEGVYWRGETMGALVAASPTGHLVFEHTAGPMLRAMVVNDLGSSDWFALITWWRIPEHCAPAKLPAWM
jgi:hypothetical protein